MSYKKWCRLTSTMVTLFEAAAYIFHMSSINGSNACRVLEDLLGTWHYQQNPFERAVLVNLEFCM